MNLISKVSEQESHALHFESWIWLVWAWMKSMVVSEEFTPLL